MEPESDFPRRFYNLKQAVHFVSNLYTNLYTKILVPETDLYTPSKSRSGRPRDLKLHRVMSNINTNRFQVVWDRSGQFLEKVHFCSFCSFWGPGTISGVLHSCTTKFRPIYIMCNHYQAKWVQKQAVITLSRFCRNSVSCIQFVYNLYTKIRNHQLLPYIVI